MALRSTPEDAFDGVPNYDYEPRYVSIDAPESPEMAYVDTDPAGDAAETFLCLHGEPTWGFLYRTMLPTLAERGRVVVPDFIGFGRSDKYTEREAYTYRLHYDALEQFVAALDLQDVTLVCQDWGGILGLPVAVNNEERFARLVPMNTGCPTGADEMAEEWYEFRDFVESVDELPIGMLIANATVSDLDEEVLAAYEAPFPDEELKAGAREWPDMVPRADGGDGAEITAPAREKLGEWEKPAFVLFGDSDPITGPARDPLRELIPTASEEPDVWIEDAAHFLQEDAGEEIAEEIVAFVDRTPR
ncbi:haloalkane dehalogenase [Salinarchaeum sp. Harcht-Bsk1]|uniref:haloalkane dehalogenase n=1 Tax=Salinarchaeum sp. Harcht-Bsk1 TaxID=1333523 RepID=UPI00034247DA|nr:haloalkane dehalogenase [Salinarchaeum sp. Harcht-Bsk1]AGN01003.1 haloalkane dehalogenase [Salinarchaeum sp. Harcht-Bsk1]